MIYGFAVQIYSHKIHSHFGQSDKVIIYMTLMFFHGPNWNFTSQMKYQLRI